MAEEGCSDHRDLKHLLLLEAKKILLSNQLDSSFESSVRHRINSLEQEVWALSVSAGGTSEFHSVADSIMADVDDELNDLLDHYRAANWNHMRQQPPDASSESTIGGSLRYTVPKALQYRMKLRDTKMNGMSMYENEAHHPPAAAATNETTVMAIDTSSSSKALKGSSDRAGDMKSFLDSSPSLTHSLHDLAQVMEQSRREGGGSVEAALEAEGGIEFCIVEADWARLQSASTMMMMQRSVSEPGCVGLQSMLTPLLPPRRSWRYPASLQDGRQVNNTQELQDQSFFFPSGVKVDVLGTAVADHRCRASQHMRHIVPFTDAHGRPTYACVLTVTQRYEQDDIALHGDMVVPNLVRIAQQKQAAMCIQKCFRLFIAHRKAQVWQMRRPAAVASPPDTRTSASSSLFQRRLSDLSLLSDSTHGGSAGGTPSKVGHPNNNNYQGNNNGSNPVPGRRTFLSMFNRSNSSSTAISSSSSAVSSPSGPSGPLPKTPSPAAAVGSSRASSERRDSINSSADKQARASAAKQRYSLERADVSGYLRSKVIVAQKAYCIISVSQHYTFIFKVLDAIAAAEAAASLSVVPVTELGAMSLLRNRFLELVESFLLAHLVDRQVWGTPLYRLARSVGSKKATTKKSPRSSSTSIMSSSRSPVDDHDHDGDGDTAVSQRFHRRRVVQHIRVSGYVADFPICVASLLSTQEWTTAVLFTHLSSQIVCKVINLLLMEKSLIIHGKNAGIVTSITMAVLHLIEPFCWEGIFVPLVPDNARELFGAPVPLIVGTTSAPRISDVSSDTAILYLNDDNVVAHPASSSSSSSAVDFKFVAWFIRLPEVSADMPFDVEICRRLDYTNALLTQYCMDRVEVKELSLYQHPSPTTGGPSPRPSEHNEVGRKSSVSEQQSSRAAAAAANPFSSSTIRISNTIDSLLMSDVPEPIVSQLRLLLSAIHRCNFRFCGSVIDDPSSWRRFLKHSSRSGEDEFYPEYFMEPLRTQLEFQDAIAHTQLFVSLMDKLRLEHMKMDEIRLFLADWIYFRWLQRRRKLRYDERR